MLPSFLLSLREGLEAALIIGIVLGTLRKIERKDLSVHVWYGAAGAAVASLIAALTLNRMGAGFEGHAEEIFEGIAMLSAALILTWMIFWMRRQAGSIQRELETDVRRAAMRGGQRALFALAFLAIGREGLELALFLTAAGINSSVWQTVAGAIAGLLVSAFLGYLLFATTRKLSLRRFFLVTNVLLILFAAGLIAHGVHEFNEAGLIPPVVEHVWDINFLLDEDSTLGIMLKALFGYNGNPSLTEVLAYSGYFVVLWLMFRRHPQLLRVPARG